MIKKITSPKNERFREFSKLYEKKHRERTGLYVIEGVNLAEEALKNGIMPVNAFIRDDILPEPETGALCGRLRNAGADVYAVPRTLFNKMSDTQTPQGIAVAVRMPDCSRDAFFSGQASNILILDRLQDPGNTGTIIRTADAAGFSRVLVMKGTADVFSPKTVRSAAGSLFRMKFAYEDSPAQALKALSAKGFKTVCASPHAHRFYYDTDLTGHVALIIGNEANGACAHFMENADIKVAIPMQGNIESLNASVSASILMYESVRQSTSEPTRLTIKDKSENGGS